MARELMKVRNLKKYFPVEKGLFKKKAGVVHAVDHVSFDIYEGETLAVVGESGCGKSTLGRTLLRIVEATEGEAFFEEKDIFKLSNHEMRELRKKMQIIFQDPLRRLTRA